MSEGQKAVFDFVEVTLKKCNCRIQTFLANGQTQYVVKKQYRNMSPSFDSLYELVVWVGEHLKVLETETNNDR